MYGIMSDDERDERDSEFFGRNDWKREMFDDPDIFDDPRDTGEDEDFGDEPLGMTDVEADADTLASAGYGTDEDYGGCDDHPF